MLGRLLVDDTILHTKAHALLRMCDNICHVAVEGVSVLRTYTYIYIQIQII